MDHFSRDQLDEQVAFLKNLDASLPTRTRISAGYLADVRDLGRAQVGDAGAAGSSGAQPP